MILFFFLRLNKNATCTSLLINPYPREMIYFNCFPEDNVCFSLPYTNKQPFYFCLSLRAHSQKDNASLQIIWQLVVEYNKSIKLRNSSPIFFFLNYTIKIGVTVREAGVLLTNN